jgi:hypothetical protein
VGYGGHLFHAGERQQRRELYKVSILVPKPQTHNTIF